MMMNEMRYAIITNPASGNMTADHKRPILAEAAAILDSEIYGLDTDTAEDLSLCAQELINHCDVLVIAGGDGTFSHIINAYRTGHYCHGQRVTIELEHPLFNQIDGNEGWSSDAFTFAVLPKALKIKF